MAKEYTREIYLYINGKKVNNDIKSIRAEMQLLINEQARMVVGSKEYVAHGQKIRSLKGILNEHALQLKNMNRTWKETMGAMGDWFNRYQALFVAAVASVVGVVMAFRKTAEAANLLEERLDNLSALTGLEGRQLEWLGKKAMESSVGITTTGVRIKQSASDIVDAYTKIGSQRPELLKNKEALATVTEAAIVLSEAAKSNLEPATLALTTTMNQFNLGANHANRIINTLAAGALVGAGEIPYLTEVLEKSGTTASLMGISIEEMTGIIEGVAPKFAKARIAGTSLDRVLLKMRAAGIGYKDGYFEIGRALDELSIRYKNGQSSVDLFGVEHAKMAEVLVMNRNLISQYTRDVTGTSVAFEQGSKNTDNMAAKLQQAKNKVTLMYIEIGQKLAPALIFSTNTLNIFLRTLMALPKFVSENRIAIVALVGAILAYNGQLIASIGASIKATAVKVKDSIVLAVLVRQEALHNLMLAAQTAQVTRLTLVQKAAVVTQWLLNAAQAANPVGLVIAGITALVAATMAYSRNNKEALALEARKKLVVDTLVSTNETLRKTYEGISNEMNKLNRLSKEEKNLLRDKINNTIELAEMTLLLQEAQRKDLYDKNVGLNFWQFITTLSNSKKLEKAKANGMKAVSDIDEKLADLRDKIQSYKDQGLTLDDILNSEKYGDAMGTQSITQLEEKLNLYTTALNNANQGTEDHIRLLKKVAATEAMLSKARGTNLGGTDEDFKRGEVLRDIDEFHRQQQVIIKKRYAESLDDKDTYLEKMDAEEIRYQMASIKRLREHGQLTAEEEIKIQDVLIGMKEDGEKRAKEASDALYKQYNDFYEQWDKDTAEFAKEAGEYWDLPEEFKAKQLAYDYWLESTYEGKMQKFKDDLHEKLICQQEYHDQVAALEKERSEKQFQQLEDYSRAAITMMDAVGSMYEAAKNRELAAAGKNDKAKEAIEKKYAKRQQKVAAIQTIIEGVMEIARVNSNAGVNADLTQSLRTVLTIAAMARTAANVAVIQSQQFSKGKYPVLGSADNHIYQASMMGRVKTGYYNKPTLGLFSEREPEIVIDGPTTRNIMANFPQIMDAINAARVNQFSAGRYPDLGGSLVSNDEMIRLLKANLRMMQEVKEAHRRPSVVSFQSIREKEQEFDSIRTKTRLG